MVVRLDSSHLETYMLESYLSKPYELQRLS